MGTVTEITFGEAELSSLVGRELPGGMLTIPSHREWLLSDLLMGGSMPFPAAGTIAHPLFVYLASGAMGVTWDELFAICGAKAEDGPMFGEHETVLRAPLAVGESYAVTGKFVSALRKEGRRVGTFDIIGFELVLRDSAGGIAATTTNSIVYPRRTP